jgi:ribosomal protein S18 acetylase RimI-like enzyme
MEEPILRAVEPTDLPFLQDVYASTRAEELAQTPWTAEQKTAFCQHQFAAQDAHYRAHYPTAQFLVIELAGARVGRLYVDHWAREIRIMDISLLPEYRGSGTGSLLLRDLQEQARRENKALSIHVEKFNRALGLYERLGFRAKEDKGVYLLMEWTA